MSCNRSETFTRVLLPAKKLAVILDLSVRTIRRYDSSGKLPAPIRIGGSVRWCSNEINAWLDADIPDRKTWEAIKEQA